MMLLFIVLSACSESKQQAAETVEASNTTFTKDALSCADKGVKYFQDIGSWPTLSDGRNAADVVAERCARAPYAFDNLE
jgi:hypothetical protein